MFKLAVLVFLFGAAAASGLADVSSQRALIHHNTPHGYGNGVSSRYFDKVENRGYGLGYYNGLAYGGPYYGGLAYDEIDNFGLADGRYGLGYGRLGHGYGRLGHGYGRLGLGYGRLGYGLGGRGYLY